MSKINTHQKDSELLQLVGFKLGKEEFAVDILNINEILKMFEVTVIPNSPNYVEGIVNIRNKIIPVVDTRQKLNMPKKEFDSDSRIMVAEIKGKTVGFIVDEVSEVIRISRDITEPPPDLVTTNIDSNFITSVARLEDRLLILIDLEKFVLTEDFVTV